MIALTTVASETEAAKLLIGRWATADDHARAQMKKNETVRHNFLLARAALRALLARATGSGGWHICPDSRGKPQALTPAGDTGAHISLSHTRGLIACAVSEEAPLGVDVEHWRPRDFTALAGYAFGPREREQVARGGIAAFYRIWTLKEAIAKADGNGLASVLDGRDRVANAPVSGFWESGQWRLFNCSPKPDYSFAVACGGRSVWSERSLNWLDISGDV